MVQAAAMGQQPLGSTKRGNSNMKAVSGVICLFLVLLLGACSGNDPYVVEYYEPAYRQAPPEPVYSRLTWSHVPEPIQPRNPDSAPLIMPVISFEMQDASLKEAIESLAATMGYRGEYPGELAGRRISIQMQGTIIEVLLEIGHQADAYTMLDHKERLVRVVPKNMLPHLPGRN